MDITFDSKAVGSDQVRKELHAFLRECETLEKVQSSPVIIFQDGKSGAYYAKFTIEASAAVPLLDTNAKLNSTDAYGFRANRELLLEHNTFKRMLGDAEKGREFNDIIVEYNKGYSPDKPLKVWGGQHRSKAIQMAFEKGAVSRYHGFRVYFCLSAKQRTEIALISNTNISVSNDLFDRLQEETFLGTQLREWCYNAGLLKPGEDFPDVGSKAERITVKLARSFITNFFLGKSKGESLIEDQLDKTVFEPYLCESGAALDSEYTRIVESLGPTIWSDAALLKAGKAFSALHRAQYEAVMTKSAMVRRKGFRNKALTESVLSSWSFVSGLLQGYPRRLTIHYKIPRTSRTIPDPLNAKEMSVFHHNEDEPTYRGLGTRSSLKDRQRMAQVFLARSLDGNAALDKRLLNKAVSQVIGLKVLETGYSK